MEILLGTTNPSKLKRFASMLDGCGCTFVSPDDLEIRGEPDETGRTPEENARMKAEFYGQYADYVLCEDSGLYLAPLALDDPRQPGLHIRTPMNGRRLDDDEMIAYYSELIRSLGGSADAYYLDAYAVYAKGRLSSFMSEELCRTRSFIMTSEPSPLRHPGWPLDSISKFRDTGLYFVEGRPGSDHGDPIALQEYRRQTTEFLHQSFGIRRQYGI
ncbi:MAG: non-canonical purine NTP pyrophosphatase [Clostridia bacterium]|nr:non-canonical purine NTP pyrophosphatase [Clostridia bacterium]